MRRSVELWNRLRDRFRREALSAELDEELRFHRARLEQDGFSSNRLGNVTYIKEETRADVVVGLLLASLGMRGLTSMLYGVTSLDVVTYLAVSCLLLIVAATASIIPARRAARIDPMIALRS